MNPKINSIEQVRELARSLSVLPISECKGILPMLSNFDGAFHWYRPEMFEPASPRIVTNLAVRPDGMWHATIVGLPLIDLYSENRYRYEVYGDKNKFLPAPTASFLRQLLPKEFEFEGAKYQLSEHYLPNDDYAVFYERNDGGQIFWNGAQSPASAYAETIRSLLYYGIIRPTSPASEEAPS